MANFFSQVKVKTAQQTQKTHFDLSCSHMTTSDFYIPQPVYIAELIPGETRKVNMQTFTRLSPLIEPFFGECRVVNRAFFVPMRTIMPEFNSFITDSPVIIPGNPAPQLISTVPLITNNQLCSLLAYNRTFSSISPTSENCDFLYQDQDDSASEEFYNFTFVGKVIYKLLISLGYKLNFVGADTNLDTTSFSALPLFAFCKIHFDWLKNSAYNTHDSIEGIWKTTTQGIISDASVESLLTACYKICYRADYFTSAWDNPVSPNSNSSSSITIPDISNSSTAAYRDQVLYDSNNSNGRGFTSPGITGDGTNGGGLFRISDYMLKTLHKVTDYVTRRRLVGSRTLDRYMADRGIQLNSAKLDRSIYLGADNVPISISDVMQTSQNIINGTTIDNGVADYSGKGIGYGKSALVDFSTDEFGYLVIISYIEPKVNYLHGRPRSMQHKTRFDFFTPEFDCLGTQAIRVDELCSNTRIGRYLERDPDAIFGWTNRYAEYKVANDNLSGDFLLGSKNTSLDGWILQRDISGDSIYNSDLLKHSLAFTEADPFKFENIWVYRNENNESAFFDHFFLKYDFKVDAYLPAKPLFDFYDWDSEGKELQMHLNGTQVTD